MSQLRTIYKKEMLESWRNFSWIWVPVVFILLMIMDPLTTYFLPKIIDSLGGMPDGMNIEMPQMAAPDALMMSLAQMSSLGALIIILLTMGTIAGERKSGVAELILVKPVSYVTYISAKWLAKFTQFFVSFAVGMLITWYYVNLLFDELGTVSLQEIISTILFYSLWIMFVITITIFFSTMLKGPGPVAGVTIVTLIAMSIIGSIVQHRLPWFPNSLSSHIHDMFYSDTIPTDLWGTGLILVILICVLLLLSFTIFKNKKITQ